MAKRIRKIRPQGVHVSRKQGYSGSLDSQTVVFDLYGKVGMQEQVTIDLNVWEMLQIADEMKAAAKDVLKRRRDAMATLNGRIEETFGPGSGSK